MSHCRIPWIVITLLSLGSMTFAQSVTPGPITPAGAKLTVLLDSMNVEQLWLRGYHVDWRTGVSEGPPKTTPGSHTHCSAFSAAVADRLGIYLLRPPEHRQTFLANAQEQWLNSMATAGWHRLGTIGDPDASLRAVALANKGKLVIAIYFQPPLGDKELSGHTAIIRPSDKSAALIEGEGPDEIQAGMVNYRSVALRDGFRSHKSAWSTGAIEYFWHDTKL